MWLSLDRYQLYLQITIKMFVYLVNLLIIQDINQLFLSQLYMLATISKSFFSVLSKSSHIIGIDLGTTNSCVAIIENKIPKVIPNAQGSNTTPSIVAFTKNGQRLVGAPAKRQSITNSDNTIFATKRLIGKRFDDPQVQKDRKHMPYKIVAGSTGEAWVEALGKKYSPAQIGAYVLMKMKETADVYLGQSIEKAVITVPAYFNESQRHATMDAGKIAGLDVVRIINEPTAAALAYGLDRQQDRKIAVYDLGGGTFDISILQIGKNVIQVKATNGDTACGGQDVDGIVQQFLLEQFKLQTGIDLSKDKTAIQRVREAAEKAKIQLSHVMQTEINLPFVSADKNGPKHFTYKLTRHQLEEQLSLQFLKRTIKPCQSCIKDSGIPKHKIDEVILVGGMSRMPKVQEIVKNLFGRTPNKSVNPDEAVAVGAAIQGGILKGDMKGMVLLDVTPLTLSTEVKGGFSFKMIPRNTPIPVKKSESFTTVDDGQTKISVKVLQGERQMAADNKFLGQFVLDGIAPGPKGNAKIQTTFSIDANGILHVTAVDKGTGKSQSVTIQNSGRVSDSEIDRMVRDAEKFKEEDAKRQKLQMTKMEIETVADQTQTQLNQFRENIPQELIQRIEKAIKSLEDLKDKGISHSDIEAAEKAIEEAKNATLQIGVSMNKQNNSNSSNKDQKK